MTLETFEKAKEVQKKLEKLAHFEFLNKNTAYENTMLKLDLVEERIADLGFTNADFVEFFSQKSAELQREFDALLSDR